MKSYHLVGALCAIHGLIHGLGFARAIQFPPGIPLIFISKWPWLNTHVLVAGLIWLLVGLAFIGLGLWVGFQPFGAWGYPLVALTAVAQVLAVLYWQDARWSTLPNAILLGVGLVAAGSGSFRAEARAAAQQLWQAGRVTEQTNPTVSETSLPPIVGRWIQRSKGAEMPVGGFYWRQKGRMRTAPEQTRWMDVEASQYSACGQPGFHWLARVNMFPGLTLDGHDSYTGGRGHMQIRVLGWLPIVKAEGPKVDEGAALRWMAELVFCPTAAYQPFLRWDSLSPTRVRCMLAADGVRVRGEFTFSPEGDFLKFEALRYYGEGELTPWLIEPVEYGVLGGMWVPIRSRISWLLPSGKFTWYELEVTELLPNPATPLKGE